MLKGYVCLLLHTHLPFVRHPEEENFLEESWLYEAITETYIPLIQIFDQLIKDGVDFRVTMSLTPPLASMLQDPLLQNRYIRHLNKLIELSEKEIERTAYDKLYHGLALMYNRKFLEAKEIFLNHYQRNLVAAFKKFQDLGFVEIIASAATHGFLPNLQVNPASVNAQIKIGVDYYIKTFGCPPKGFWLPECAYYPGVDNVLKEAGIRYFIVDSHGILHADPRPKYSVYAPLFCPSGVAAFGRDWESSKQVWSAKEGYPGDADYREYYRDIGFELDYEYIKPYIHQLGFRTNTGIKYWRITGNTEYKEVYRPDWAREKAASHAGNFMFNREKQVEHLSAHMDRKPLILAPYDAELFGHWWYEGPLWIDFLMRKVAFDQKTIKFITPGEYLTKYPTNQMAMPSASTWGWKGHNEFWLEGSNDWVYPHLHAAAEQMTELAQKFAPQIEHKLKKKTLLQRALNQAVRELVLAESSDWPFIMKTNTMVPYAHKRVKQHLNRFGKLREDILHDTIDVDWLTEVEWRDNIFADMDCAEYYLLQKKPKKIKSVKTTKLKRKKKAYA